MDLNFIKDINILIKFYLKFKMINSGNLSGFNLA